MRTGKEILFASKEFTGENRTKSWFEIIITLVLAGVFFSATLLDYFPILIRVVTCIVCGLLYVRLFVIYHDYQHRAILQNSIIASLIMKAIGIFLLAPETIWKRSHEHHHNNNSKLTIAGIGSYPTICKTRYLKLTRNEKRIYLLNRHPLTVIFGYFTLFVYWLNLKSFIQSPSRHLDSLLALIFHVAAGTLVWVYFGPLTFLICWFIPFLIALVPDPISSTHSIIFQVLNFQRTMIGHM
jgi:omega-6 fatty acid desaturase (delta-12 desaturase)